MKTKIEVDTQPMFLMVYGLTEKQANRFAESHKKWREKMHYRKGVAVVKTGKRYALYSALMAP